MGFTDADLIPVTSTLSAANKSHIKINGAILLNMSGIASDGSEIMCTAMVYVSVSVSGFYLSYDTMVDLGIIVSSFPTVDDAFLDGHLNAGIDMTQFAATATSRCSCPVCKPIPPRPSHLLFECTPKNIDSMCAWLRDQFSACTFNTCPHQPLPEMSGPPIEIHLDPAATPRVCHTPANVPLHWQDRVKADLERDVDLGVIERVPYGDLVSWCHRMVVTQETRWNATQNSRPITTEQVLQERNICNGIPISFSTQSSWSYMENCYGCMEWVSWRPATRVRSSSNYLYNTIR